MRAGIVVDVVTDIAPTAAFGSNGPTIQDPKKRCPKCKYSLCGLPSQGRCPECGLTFDVAEPDPALAVQRFRESFPRPVRWIVIRASKSPGRIWSSLVRTICFIVLVSAFFVFAQMLAVRVAILVDGNKRWLMGEIVVAEYRAASRREPVKVYADGAVLVGGMAFVGQTTIVFGILCWHTFATRRLREHQTLLRRLGAQATAFVPLAMIVVMVPVIFWQLMNVWFPARSPGVGTWLRMPFSTGVYVVMVNDLVQYAGFLVLMIGAIAAALLIYCCNRNAILAASWALGRVRVVR